MQIIRGVCAKRVAGEKAGFRRGRGDYRESDIARFCDDVRRRMEFEGAGSDPYRVLQLMTKMAWTKWASNDEHQSGARSLG